MPIEINELFKLANQLNSQLKGPLMIEAAKIIILFFLETKNKLVTRSIAIKEEVKNIIFDQKKTHQG